MTLVPIPQLNQLTRTMYPGAQEKVDQRLCPQCGTKIDPEQFQDGLSLHEYMTSGLCQSCQNRVFGKEVFA
ncbi:hypothetical protein [Methanolobus sp.]|uniref:hypothetical protein n=1 Tax=Methanolobus sp. TaxID=1874737 RepID=UPI0025D8954C|nr:hypothetical protein [Methanolobus sp.]